MEELKELLERKEDLQKQGFTMNFFIAQVDAEIKEVNKKIKHKAKVAAAAASAAEPVEARAPRQKVLQISEVSATVRTRFKHETTEELHQLKVQKKHHEDTMYRLRNDAQPFKVEETIVRIRDRLVALETEIEVYVQKIIDIEEGLYDEKLVEEINTNMDMERKKKVATQEKKQKKAPQKVAFVFQYDPMFVHPREVDRQLARYMSDFAKFPENLKDKLRHMPNNQGFLWRGSCWFGELPDKEPRDVCVVTERVNLDGGGFEIHEHVGTPRDYTIYRKTIEYERGRRHMKKEVVYQKIKKN